MKTIKINQDKYSLPENWTEVKLRQLQELCIMVEKNKKVAEVDSVTQLNAAVEILSIITECPRELLMKADVKSITNLCNEIGWTSDFSEETLGLKKKNDKGELIPVDLESLEFVINGQSFVFDHSMNITFGQMIDIEQVTNSTVIPWDNAHLILAILMRPAKKRSKTTSKVLSLALTEKFKNDSAIKSYAIKSASEYKIEKYDWDSVESRGQLFKDYVSVADAFKVTFFLAFLKKEFTERTLASLADKELMNLQRKD